MFRKLKIEKLNQLSRCIKCGNLNHQSPQCKFKFQRKCKTCSKWHFDFLCSQWSTVSPKSKVPAKFIFAMKTVQNPTIFVKNAKK